MEEILKGLKILSKYCPTGQFSAEHDQVWAGDDASKMKVSKGDAEELDKLGWWIDKETDYWSTFC